MKKSLVCLSLIIFVSLPMLHSQSGTNNPIGVSTQFDTTGFPQWAKDLRRAEIIAFGAFPFAYFLTNFSVDSYRWVNHDGDRRYAPWPFDAAGSVNKTQDERFMTLGIAVGGAVLIAVVDYSIERYKRYTKEKEYRSLPEGTPIIIRRPMNSDAESSEHSGSVNP